MPVPTMKLRIFRPLIKVDQDPNNCNDRYSHGEPVWQQLWERTDAEIEMLKRLRNIDAPKTEWRDIPIVLEERNNVQK